MTTDTEKNETDLTCLSCQICFFGKTADLNTNGSNPQNKSSWTHYYSTIYEFYTLKCCRISFHQQDLGAHSVRNSSSNHLAKLRGNTSYMRMNFPPIFSSLWGWDLAHGKKHAALMLIFSWSKERHGNDHDQRRASWGKFGDTTHSWKCNRSLSHLSCFSFNKKTRGTVLNVLWIYL